MPKKKYFEAYSLLKFTLTSLPESKDQNLIRAEIKFLLEEAIISTPDAAYIYHLLGNLYRNPHVYSSDSVVKYCNKAIELAPNWLTPYHELVEEYNANTAEIFKAESLILQALNLKPDSYLLNLLLSWAMNKQCKFELCDSICRELIRMKPNLFNAWSTIVQNHADQHDWNSVIEFAEKSFELEPGVRNWAWGWYFKALLEAKNEPKAFELMNSNSEFNKVYMDDCSIIFSNYYYDRKKYKESLASCEKLLRSPTSPLFFIADAYLIQGKIAFENNEFDRAHQLFEESIEVDPTPGSADCIGRCWLAEMENRKGNYLTAENLFKESFDYPKGLKWGHGMAYFMYGNFLLDRNREAEALEQYQKSLEILPYGYEGYYGLARYYAKKNNSKVSLDYLEKAIELFYPISGPILSDIMFEKIIKTNRFKKLIKTHFKNL